MAFTFTKDTLFTQGSGNGQATCIYTLKTALVAGGWTVMSSGSGTGNSYSSNSDLITTAAIMNNTQAWFRIRAPVGTRELIFQRCANDNAWRIKVCPNGFTGGSPAAGVVPSGDATDTIIYGSSADATPSGAALSSGGTPMRAHIAVGSIADGYGWYLISNDVTSGTRQFCLMVDPIDGYSQPPGDPDPYIYYFCGYASFNAINAPGSTNRMSYGDRFTSLWAYWSSTTPAIDITAVIWWTYSGAWQGLIPSGVAVNPWNSKDESFPIVFARTPTRTGQGGYKGIVTMMRWVGQNRGTGNTFSVNTTSDRYAYNEISLPWDGTTPSI